MCIYVTIFKSSIDEGGSLDKYMHVRMLGKTYSTNEEYIQQNMTLLWLT